ncbi:MAG: DUF3299 domain-containing protein [Gallionellaceae bacterium]
MQNRSIFQSAVLMLFLSGLAGSAAALDSKKADYKVGDRLQQHAAAAKSAFKLITWDDLMPKDWDPMTDFKKLDFSKLKDSDPRAQEALQNLREAWNKAPIEPSMDGARIRIPGFIVPLEVAQHQITEFLLVPYFGACIHVPPPPANQIIHVFPAKPLKKGLQSMDAVWISGMLETVPSDTDMGSASYRMKAEVVEAYKN